MSISSLFSTALKGVMGFGVWTNVAVISAGILGIIAYHEFAVIAAYHRGDTAGYERRTAEDKKATDLLNQKLAALAAKADDDRRSLESQLAQAASDIQFASAPVTVTPSGCTPEAAQQVVKQYQIPENVRVKLNRKVQ